ncbi:MAG: RHS repeat-associated core domain-containing protein, partial [Candidatus Promineifilaceae bacterium]
VGLIYMNARFYVPAVGRFASADSIVPDNENPEAFNRYSYSYNNPVNFVDPSGHDPLDEQWRAAFQAAHNRSPEWYDRLIRLFSLAFPDEWDWSAFYSPDGALRGTDQLRTILGNAPGGRNWDSMPALLERLAGWYESDETEAFVRDIGTLFAGLSDRFQSSTNFAVTGCETGLTCDNVVAPPSHAWAYLQVGQMPEKLTGTSDPDANVHHWAWALVLGYQEGSGAIAINSYREFQQAGGPIQAFRNVNSRADIWLGNRGALLGNDLRTFGASANTIRFFWQVNVAEW